jgi:glycosyltransferase involved in cell wall biosynthesis
MNQKLPLVSIGMPVYNGEEFIQKALDSLLAQDYPNFEIIVSDNASTDKTQEICINYANKDERIKYYRNAKNLGAMPNFDKVLEISQGKYFMWAAHDDLWERNFVSVLVNHLMSNENIVLAMTETQYRLSDGLLLPFFPEGQGFYREKTSESQLVRLLRVTNHNYGNLIYGLYTREALFRSNGCSVLESVNSLNENPIFLHVASIGSIIVNDKVLFYKTTSLTTYLQAAREYNFLPSLDGINCYKNNQGLSSDNSDNPQKTGWLIRIKQKLRFIKKIPLGITNFSSYAVSIAKYHYQAWIDIKTAIYNIDSSFYVKAIVILVFTAILIRHYLKLVVVWQIQDFCQQNK